MKNHEEIMKKSEDTLWTGKFVKCSGKFKKILKILWQIFGKMLKKHTVNFEKIRLLKKIDNFNEKWKVTRSLY